MARGGGGGLGRGGQAEPGGSSRGERSTAGHAWSHAPIVHVLQQVRQRGVDSAVSPIGRHVCRFRDPRPPRAVQQTTGRDGGIDPFAAQECLAHLSVQLRVWNMSPMEGFR